MLLLNINHKNRRTHNTWQALNECLTKFLLIVNEVGFVNNTSYAVQTEVFIVFCVQLDNSGIIPLQNNSVEFIIIDIDLTDIKGFGDNINPKSHNHYF